MDCPLSHRKKPKRPLGARVPAGRGYIRTCVREARVEFSNDGAMLFLLPGHVSNTAAQQWSIGCLHPYGWIGNEGWILPATRLVRHVFGRQVDLADDFTWHGEIWSDRNRVHPSKVVSIRLITPSKVWCKKVLQTRVPSLR